MPLPNTRRHDLICKNNTFFLIIFQSTTTRPILPLPLSNLYHSNRLDLPYRSVLLPPNHCHSLRHATPPNIQRHIFCKKTRIFLTIIQTIITLPILPLPHWNYHHSNRTDLTNRLVLLPPNHCHSPRHATPSNIQHLIFCKKKTLDFRSFLNILQLRQYCHYHFLTTTIRTALISPIDWCYSHPTTATPHAMPLPPISNTLFFVKKHVFFWRLFKLL
jgi:hypothetical protein